VTDRVDSAIPQSMHGAAPEARPRPPESNEVPDAELVAAARVDRRAFDAVYRRYVPRVYRFARARVGSEQDAEDVTTATFLEAFTSLDGYQEQGHFAAWLFTIARRQVLALHRRAPVHEDLATTPLAAPALEVRDESAVLHRVLGRLSEDRREALLLRFYGDLKITEIAAVMGKNESAVKMLLHRALAQLHDLLREDPRG
jgi:RNA polymerase sigma-70 factor, ECF subfamily